MRNRIKVELIDLLDKHQNKVYLDGGGGEYAKAEIGQDSAGLYFSAERTLGVPARFAVQELSPYHFRFIVANRIDEIRAVWKEGFPDDVWIKPFDASYTEMWPAYHRVKVPVPAVRERHYHWLLTTPAHEHHAQMFNADVDEVGAAYIMMTAETIADQVDLIPNGVPIAISLSGGTDSSGVLATLLHALNCRADRHPVHCITLAIDGGGSDLNQARQVAAALQPKYGHLFEHHIIDVDSSTIDHNDILQRAARTTEDYRILDLESAMACTILFDAVKREEEAGRLLPLRYEFNGDGGNEVFLDYPLTGRGHRPILMEEIWINPHLFLLGYGRGRLTNPMYSAGLSRGYTRTFNPARDHGVTTFSPLIDARVIDVGTRIPFRELAPTEADLHRLRGLAVQTGVKAYTGIEIPVFPKTMFQDGASAKPGLIRVSEEESSALKAQILRG